MMEALGVQPASKLFRLTLEMELAAATRKDVKRVREKRQRG
jgi:hypothetical protein